MKLIGHFSFKYKKTVIGIWAFIIIAFGFFALQLPSVLSGNGFEFDGEYKETRQILDEDFEQAKSTIILLFEKENSVSEDDWHTYINDTLDNTRNITDLKGTVSPFDREGMITDNTSYGLLLFEKDSSELGDTINDLDQLLKNEPGLKVTMTGEPVIVQDLNEASQKDLVKAESIGLPIALIVLILAFGGLVAAGIPLVIGVVSILTTMGIVYFLSYSFSLSIFVLNIVPMIGLALSIDFALLVINRFKEEIKTRTTQEAVQITVLTAGRSIVFSGLCVFIGLLGLMFIQIDIFQNVALGGMAVVLVAALAAITLLPALLGLLGHKINALSIFKANSRQAGMWSSFAKFVMKKPLIMALTALFILIVGLIPVKDINLSIPGTDSLPETYQSRIAYETFTEKFIPADRQDDKHVTIIFETDRAVLTSASLEDIKTVTDLLLADEDVSEVESPFSLSGIQDPAAFAQAASQEGNSPLASILDNYTAGDKMLVNVYLKEELTSRQAQEWIRNWSNKDLGVTTFFGGSIKFEQEIFDEIYEKAPQGLLLILVSTFIILMIAFRSILIPLKAIIMNILSLAATFGIVVWIFQEGHLGIEPTSIALILPVFVFSLVFGLSMDYEVFLISRIQEVYHETGDNDQATYIGLTSTSKIITSAAAIMIVVTGAFAFTGVVPVKQIGIGIALAIFIDATIVRMVLVPALMKLLGDWNWWFFGLQKKPVKKAQASKNSH